MPTPPFTPFDREANRRAWAEWLRRPDWRMIPDPGGAPLECHTPWDVGCALAAAYWPPYDAVMDTFPNLMDAEDAEDEVMLGCYGVYDGGVFDPDELPDHVRSVFVMVEQAARSAPPYPDRDAEDARSILEGLSGDSSWHLFALSHALTVLWEYDPSPMRGAVLDLDATARLIADILDAAPPSLLELELDLSEYEDE